MIDLIEYFPLLASRKPKDKQKMIQLKFSEQQKFNPTKDRMIHSSNFKDFRETVTAYKLYLSSYQCAVYINDIVVRYNDLSEDSRFYISKIYDVEYSDTLYLNQPFWTWKISMLKHFGFTHLMRYLHRTELEKECKKKLNKAIKKCFL